MKHLLLIGAGHAHLYVMKQLQKNGLPGVKVTLLTFDDYQYFSERFSGYAEGIYGLDDIRVNARELAGSSGISWMKGAAVSLDPDRKTVLTDQGKQLSYDVVSFDIGCLTAGTDRPGALEYGETIQPNAKFPEAVRKIRESEHPVIVGGGVISTELAFSLQTWRNKNGKGPLVLVCDGALFEGEMPGAGKKAEALARKKGITLHLHDGAEAVTDDKVVTVSNRKINYDRLLWMPGLRPHQLFASSLPVDRHGYLLVEETLQVKRYPSMFGAGSCVSVTGVHQPPSGVFPVRQAQTLWENLNGYFGAGEGHLYHPQPSSPLILSTGNRRGLIIYKGKMFHGRWVGWLKHRIGKNVMRRYQ